MDSFVLGVDLGGTKVFAAVLDGEGNIVGRARAKTKAWRGSEYIFETVVRVANRAIKRAGLEPGSICALGIGAPGPLDPDSGYIIEAENLKLKNFPLGPRLFERFGCPIIVDNDVSAGTYGEFKLGRARGASDVLCMFIGTGIGGGLIINGSLYRGFSKNAGEFGHMIIQAGGPRCGCGKRGCLEAIASRIAMTRDLRKAIKRGQKSLITDLFDNEDEAIPSTMLKQAYDAGDKLVIKIVHRAAKYIGISIGNLVNALGPQVFVLGGGVIEAFGDPLIERIDSAAREVGFEYGMKEVKIVRAGLGDDAGVIGAAMLARESLKQ